MATRRDFIKKCAVATCACYFIPFLKATASNLSDTNTMNPEEKFHLTWIQELLENINELNLSEEQLRRLIKGSSKAHNEYKNLIKSALSQHGPRSTQFFRELLYDKLPSLLTDSQRNDKVKNLLASLRREGIIKSNNLLWVLCE